MAYGAPVPSAPPVSQATYANNAGYANTAGYADSSGLPAWSQESAASVGGNIFAPGPNNTGDYILIQYNDWYSTIDHPDYNSICSTRPENLVIAPGGWIPANYTTCSVGYAACSCYNSGYVPVLSAFSNK